MVRYLSSLTRYVPSRVWHTHLLMARFFIGLVFILLTLLQLFAYEDFPEVMSIYGFGDGSVLAALVIVLETLAVPYLLSMSLPRYAEIISRVSGLLALTLWVFLISWGIGGLATGNSGLLGAKINLPVGWLSYIIAAVLLMWGIFLSAGDLVARIVKKI